MNPHLSSDVSCQCCASHVRDEFPSTDEEQAAHVDLGECSGNDAP
jgi:hypothetical protein